MKIKLLLISALLACSIAAANYTTPDAYAFPANPPQALCDINIIFCSNAPQSYLLVIKNDGSTYYRYTLTGRNSEGVLQVYAGDVDSGDRSYTNTIVMTDVPLFNYVLDVKGYR